MKRLVLALLPAACSSSDGNDVSGPFTGTTHQFVVDRITVPATSDESTAFAGDLDGNGVVENKLGLVTAVLATTNDLSVNSADMIAAGSLRSLVTIKADDLENDDSVAVTFFGAADGTPAAVAGGRIVGGVFRSNRAATTRLPGRADVHLPIYTNADPLILQINGLEIDLDPDSNGGYTAIIRGGVRQDEARMVAYAGLQQMFETEPERHLVFQRQVDMDRDGVMSVAELEESVIALLVTADIQLFDGSKYSPQPTPTLKDSLSIAFGAHLAPCPPGPSDRCITATPAEPCRDRIRDNAETDVDCGGPTCQKCAAQKSCSAPSDCQTNACIAGTCAAASCTNNVRDAYESDVDCGSTCGRCAIGQQCAHDTDCANNNCDNGIATVGRCVATQ